MKTLYQIYKQHSTVFIDTRAEVSKGLFFAVGQKNEKGVHRGNDFAFDAINSQKAAYAVINDAELKQQYADDNRYILVEDVEKTLQELARYHRQQLTCPILAIAGSNGKTTIKELLTAVLSNKFHVFSTKGNLNNHLGVPLSLLSIDNSYDFVLLEIGANHLEETRFLSEIVLPDFGLVTNCGKDHLGEYGSIENIIKANKELYDVLVETNKTAFVCENDSLLVDISKELSSRVFYGGTAAVQATILETPFLKFQLSINNKKLAIQTHLFGRFWLDALLGAAAVGHYFGVSIEAIKVALESYYPAALRSQLIDWQGNKVLLDCYNANPSSMEVFLDEIQQSSMSVPPILVLGEMLELGVYSKKEHQLLIDNIDYKNYEAVLLLGTAFLDLLIPTSENLHHFLNRETLQEFLSEKAYSNKYFFVKGSRSNKLENLFS